MLETITDTALKSSCSLDVEKYSTCYKLAVLSQLMEFVALKSSSDSVSLCKEEFSYPDDDCNHKHRRQQALPEPSSTDAFQQLVMTPSEKVHERFESEHLFPEKKDISTKFGRSAGPSVSVLIPEVPFDSNQRVKQASFVDPGPGRGRGRDASPWSQYNSSYPSADVLPHIVHQGSISLSGNALPKIPYPHSALRDAYGASNGGFDHRSLYIYQGASRPPLSSSLSLGFPRLRCTDFEELGYCLRGDMCPMEHGIYRIVVEDVQSLSQFNLPLSISSTNLQGTSAVAGPPPPANVPSVRLMNDKEPLSNSKGRITGDDLIWNHEYSCSTDGGDADLYDPDQPLWNSFDSGTSSSLFTLLSRFDEAEIMTNDVVHRARESAEVDTHNQTTGHLLANLSHWKRGGISRSVVTEKSKLCSAMGLTRLLENDTNSEEPFITSRCQATDPSLKTQDDVIGARKPTQKAERTLFVSGIPQQSNKVQSLLSHFRKFGEVTDIYIYENSQRAFIQFSKWEEAEAALKAPDAVLGNRFIKLSWANRDRIRENGIRGGSSTYKTHGQKSGLVPSWAFVRNSGKDNVQHGAAKADDVQDLHISSSPHPRKMKPGPTNGSRVLPPLNKKLATVEQLKEELRKKQELLEQKQKDFKRQLEKLEKQAAGIKGDVAAEEPAKRQKLVSACDVPKSADLGSSKTGSSPGSCNTANIVTLPHAKMADSQKKSADNAKNPNTSSVRTLQDSTSFKPFNCPTAPLSTSFLADRYKVDSRPTAFKIIPPLPSGLANVAALKEHFSPYGEHSNVEFKNIEANADLSESWTTKNCSACVRFTTRQSAERAFMHGKCWKGHYMQFLWLKSNDSIPAAKVASETDNPSAGKESSISSHGPAAWGAGNSGISESKLFCSNNKAGEVC
ncbi:zinc finger CCCH domain-containing protein 41-like isoform X1 [Punica granatum]|nr:zinc finger CCCH domain-containing protein 41-like isoform X1 [Punica granatum]XP_031405170.1 zinc finger CCCH domain-containing protein 41-like isoform X1 [Punica granatum]XP_031405172.1 zinc finger CCCH domain-containing protein 41-like isoform X1 [Punica granatum]